MTPVERTFETERQRRFSLECRPPDGPPTGHWIGQGRAAQVNAVVEGRLSKRGPR